MSQRGQNGFHSRRALVGATAVILGLLAAWGYARLRPNRDVVSAAFVLAVDSTSRVQIRGWWATHLQTSFPLSAGRTARVPAGSTVKVVYPDGHTQSVVGPQRIRLPDAGPPDELDYFRSPLAQVAAQARLADHPLAKGIVVTSPVGVTRFLNPILMWTARDGADYDVAVRDPTEPEAPARIARHVRPPIALAQLETPQRRELLADRIYEIIVRKADSDAVVGVARFLTTAEAAADTALPAAPADLLAEAVAAMAKKPTRTGDAWVALSRLPAEWRRCELAVRLRLRVAVELGLADELTSAQADARQEQP